MYTRSFRLVLVLLLVGGLWWLQAKVPAPPVVSAPTITPNLVIVNTPTLLTATVHIPDPTLNPANVDLIRINASGASNVVAQMVDNGQNGDQKPGDKIFTARFTLREPQVGKMGFQVSAAFRGKMRQTLSSVFPFVTLAPITIQVVLPPDPGEAGKATLQGIDSDGDGVRDDIQRYIVFTSPHSEKMRAGLTQMAKAAQLFVIQSADSVASRNSMAAFIGGQDCLAYSTSEEMAIIIKRTLRVGILNTRARTAAWLNADAHSWGNVGTIPATASELKAGCVMNPDTMAN